MNTSMPKARCSGCGQARQVTTAGLMRRHNQGAGICPGAGQLPDGDVPDAAPKPKGTVLAIPAPTEPTFGRSCDGGRCDAPSVGWRLFRDWREWLPVCGLHMEGPANRTRVYDRDIAGGGES